MSCVYYICSPETGRVKIGYTQSQPEVRLRAMRTGSPTEIYLLAVHPGDRSTEAQLHQRFANDRAHGEWFEASDELLDHLFTICWLTHADAVQRGCKPPEWARVGLLAAHEISPLPPEMLAALS